MGGVLANLYVLWPGVSIGIMFVGGLLALYLCTRNCCGLILNLFFAALSFACGIALFYSGFSRPLGILLIIVGVLMTVAIIVAYVYHRATGRILCYYYEDEPCDGVVENCNITYPLSAAATNLQRFQPQQEAGRSNAHSIRQSELDPCQFGRVYRQVDASFLLPATHAPMIYNDTSLMYDDWPINGTRAKLQPSSKR